MKSLSLPMGYEGVVEKKGNGTTCAFEEPIMMIFVAAMVVLPLGGLALYLYLVGALSRVGTNGAQLPLRSN